MSHAPEHPTRHATALLALSLVLLMSNALELVLIGVLAFLFFLSILILLGLEERANERGESLVYPWRVPSTRRETRRIDGVLSTSIRRLKSGEDEVEVLATLHLHPEGVLSGEAGRHYRRAVEGLRDAAARDWVFDAEARERSLDEAERELWMTRAEYLRELN